MLQDFREEDHIERMVVERGSTNVATDEVRPGEGSTAMKIVQRQVKAKDMGRQLTGKAEVLSGTAPEVYETSLRPDGSSEKILDDSLTRCVVSSLPESSARVSASGEALAFIEIHQVGGFDQGDSSMSLIESR